MAENIVIPGFEEIVPNAVWKRGGVESVKVPVDRVSALINYRVPTMGDAERFVREEARELVLRLSKDGDNGGVEGRSSVQRFMLRNLRFSGIQAFADDDMFQDLRDAYQVDFGGERMLVYSEVSLQRPVLDELQGDDSIHGPHGYISAMNQVGKDGLALRLRVIDGCLEGRAVIDTLASDSVQARSSLPLNVLTRDYGLVRPAVDLLYGLFGLDANEGRLGLVYDVSDTYLDGATTQTLEKMGKERSPVVVVVPFSIGD